MNIDSLLNRVLAGVVALAAGGCLAATATPPTPGAAPAQAAAASAPSCPDGRDLARVRVEAVTLAGESAAPGADPAIVGLRDEISVKVSGLQTLIDRQRCATTKRKIVLFLDGRPVPTAAPYPPVDPASEELRFVLNRDEQSREVWTHLLGRPNFANRPTPVSVGLADEYAVASDASISLTVIPKGWFWTWSVILVLLLAAFLALAMKSDVLRDSGVTDAGRKPYSLAKVQAAWWFFLILTSYLLIGLVTGDYNTSITPTVLSLMGISAATAVGSAVIDAGKDKPEAAATPGAGAATQPITRKPSPVTRGRWWLDILSDENGVNFHRFQMAAWTAVLGVIFIHAVYVSLAMPEFSNTLLGLLGISSGTYLGLKTTSEKAPKPG